MAKTQPFKVGDKVKIKSGGPVMTVSDPEEYGGTIVCQWFAGAKLSRGSFKPDELERVEDEKK